MKLENRNETAKQTEILLKEYELCTTEVRQMEGLVWTTAGALGLVSIIGIGFLSNALPQNAQFYDYLLRIGIALLSMSLVWIWRTMTSRWHSIQRVMIYRICEIEEELGMYKERYVEYLDKAILKGKKSDNPQVSEMISEMTTRKAKHTPKGARRSVQNLGWVLLVAWVIFLLFQIAAMLKWM